MLKERFGSFVQMRSQGFRRIVPVWTREIWWRTEKEKMDVATGRTWTSYEWSRCAWLSIEHLQKEYWQTFVDDNLLPRDATDLQATAQPKAVLSHSITVMDKICGWSEEEKWWVLCLQLVLGSTPSASCVMARNQRRTS